MSKGSYEYPEGVHVYQHRYAVDENGDPLVLMADARIDPVIDPQTRQPKVDPLTGRPILAPRSNYGVELHKQLSVQPDVWTDITAPAPEAPAKRAPRATIRKKQEAPAEESAEQEPAE